MRTGYSATHCQPAPESLWPKFRNTPSNTCKDSQIFNHDLIHLWKDKYKRCFLSVPGAKELRSSGNAPQPNQSVETRTVHLNAVNFTWMQFNASMKQQWSVCEAMSRRCPQSRFLQVHQSCRLKASGSSLNSQASFWRFGEQQLIMQPL